MKVSIMKKGVATQSFVMTEAVAVKIEDDEGKLIYLIDRQERQDERVK